MSPIDTWSDPDNVSNQQLLQSQIMQKSDYRSYAPHRSFRRYYSNRGLAKAQSIPWMDTAIDEPYTAMPQSERAKMTHFFRFTVTNPGGSVSFQRMVFGYIDATWYIMFRGLKSQAG